MAKGNSRSKRATSADPEREALGSLRDLVDDTWERAKAGAARGPCR